MQQDNKGKHTLHHTSVASLSLPSQTLFFVSVNLDVIGVAIFFIYTVNEEVMSSDVINTYLVRNSQNYSNKILHASCTFLKLIQLYCYTIALTYSKTSYLKSSGMNDNLVTLHSVIRLS